MKGGTHVVNPILAPPLDWAWAPVEIGTDFITTFAHARLESDELEQVDTLALGRREDELDGFAAAILAVEHIATLQRDEAFHHLAVHCQYEGIDYVYFERNSGDVAGLIRKRPALEELADV